MALGHSLYPYQSSLKSIPYTLSLLLQVELPFNERKIRAMRNDMSYELEMRSLLPLPLKDKKS